jgi:putative DNA primase/helicase
MSSLLDAALWYATHKHWHVFPLRPGSKLPATEHGFKDATTDEAAIRAWWGANPHYNVGVATGDSGLGVADVDVKNDAQGMESWRDLRQAYGAEIEETLISETPTGGMHVWYLRNGYAIGNSAGKLGPGLDVRAIGGYVVAPPSVTPDGEYRWALGHNPTEKALAPFPKALVGLLADGHKPAEHLRARARGEIAQGKRNSTLTSIAGLLRSRGMSPDGILQVLRTENQRCAPPLDEAELAKIAGSMARYEPDETFNLTDLGNGLRFVALEGERARYCAPWGKWLLWDGRRWMVDEHQEVEVRAVAVIRDLLRQAAATDNDEERKALTKHARVIESRRARRDFLASAQPYLAIAPEALDADPWLLNCRNGTLDLRTGEIKPADPKDYITKCAPADYDPDAECPTWQAFERTIAGGDAELVAFKQRAFGYGLTGDVSEQVFFLHYGTGANGKSTELTAIRDVLGEDYAFHTPTDTLLAGRYGSIPNDVARLKGARFVTAVESEAGRRLAEALVKQLTGGDTITARFMRAEWFSFKPTHKIYLAANHKPEIRGTDHAMWRRVRLIPYEVTIPDDEQDKHLGDKLRAEASGILAWLVRGCLEWQHDKGLTPPQAVLKATESYRNEMDVLGDFIADCCVLWPSSKVTAKDIYDAYLKWADENGEKDKLTKTMFGLRLRERGVKDTRIGHAQSRGYAGIGLKGDALQVEIGQEQEVTDSELERIAF